MKQSLRTGEAIYNEIKKLNDELQELGQALDEIEERTLPHRLLSEAHEAKRQELLAAKRAEYTA